MPKKAQPPTFKKALNSVKVSRAQRIASWIENRIEKWHITRIILGCVHYYCIAPREELA
jgi:hypothetical protein